MPSKKPVQEVDLIDAVTFLRMDNEARELVELAHYGRPTPISGDAIQVYSEMFQPGVAETSKVRNNRGMDNNTTATVSTAAIYSTVRHEVVPVTITIHYTDTDFDQVFNFDESTGAYFDEDYNELSVSFDANWNIVSYDVPESM